MDGRIGCQVILVLMLVPVLLLTDPFVSGAGEGLPTRGPEDELDAQYGTNPVSLDGSNTGNEWSDAKRTTSTLGAETFYIYTKQDGSFLYIGLEYPIDSVCDICIDVDNDGGSAPQTDDLQLHVSYSQLELLGTGIDWEYSTVSGWSANLDWVAFREVRISYSKLDLAPGIPKTMGIAIQIVTTTGNYYWPDGADLNVPSTWGMIYSNHNWDAPVIPNDPPVLENGAVDPTIGTPDDVFDFTVDYSDADNEAPAEGVLVLDGVEYDMSGTGTDFTIPVAFHRYLSLPEGIHNFHFRFSDGSDVVRFPAEGNITGPFVRYDNTPPMLLTGGIPNGTFYLNEDEGGGTGLIDLEEYFTDDRDDGDLTFEVVFQEDEDRLRCELNGSGLDFYQMEKDWNGKLEFQVKAIDRGVEGPSGMEDILETLSNPFEVEVRPVNDRPLIMKIEEKDVSGIDEVIFEGRNGAVEDSEFSLRVEVEDIDIDTGGDDKLQASVNTTDVKITVLNRRTFELTFLPENRHVGLVYWELVVNDGKGGEDRKNVRVEVVNTNDEPTFTEYIIDGGVIPITGNRIEFSGEIGPKEDHWFNITLVGRDDDIEIGLEDALTFRIDTDNERIEMDPATGELSFLPLQEDVGTITVFVSIMDSHGSDPDDTLEIVFDVMNTNDPPQVLEIISSTGGFEFTEGDIGAIQGIIFDIDLDHDPEEVLSFTWTSDIDGPVGASNVLDTSRLSTGHHNITLIVRDKAGATAIETFKVLIKERYVPGPSDDDGGMSGIVLIFLVVGSLVSISMIVLGFALFVHMRVMEKNLLDNLRRERIFELIKKRPGIHFMEIQKEMELAMGALSHHLNLLEKHQYVRSIQDGRYRRFYLFEERIEYKLHLTSFQQMILFIVKKDPGISQSEISREVGRNRMVVNYHIRILMDIGLIALEREGRETKCFITNVGSVYVPGQA